VFGTYLHGLFDTGELTETLIRWLARSTGIDTGEMQIIPHEVYVQQQYEILAEGVRKVLDIDKIYEIMDRYEITDR
jgi:adenosylcobyric acid synthase